jgi:hypothetical protein
VKFRPNFVYYLSIAALLLVIPVLAEVQAQTVEKKHFLIREGGSLNFIPPKTPSFSGFRIALRGEWDRLDFFLESGLFRFAETDSSVDDALLIPLQFKLGYTFPLPKGFGIQPETGVGILFHKGSLPPDLLISLRLNLVYEIPRAPVFTPYVGGGMDIIRETGTDGALFTPAIEAGITIKPWRIPRRPPQPTDLVPITQDILEVVQKYGKDDTDRILGALDYYISTSIILKKTISEKTFEFNNENGLLQTKYMPDEIVIDTTTKGKKGALKKGPRGEFFEVTFDGKTEAGNDYPLTLFFTRRDKTSFDLDYAAISEVTVRSPTGDDEVLGQYMVRTIGNEPYLCIKYRKGIYKKIRKK